MPSPVITATSFIEPTLIRLEGREINISPSAELQLHPMDNWVRGRCASVHFAVQEMIMKTLVSSRIFPWVSMGNINCHSGRSFITCLIVTATPQMGVPGLRQPPPAQISAKSWVYLGHPVQGSSPCASRSRAYANSLAEVTRKGRLICRRLRRVC